MPAGDGHVRILLPDGHSLSLSVEAAERSALLLKRGAERARTENPGRAKPRRSDVAAAAATVIPVDFVRHARLA